LRHYERVGVLSRAERSANGYRSYGAETIARVRLVQSALAIGFTLQELAGILKVRTHGGAPCRKVRAMAQQKLDAFEQRLKEMRETRDQLRTVLTDWDKRLKRGSPNERLYLLENLELKPGRRPPFKFSRTTKQKTKL
jgi:DNA-binding transcriptional MerR regulator